MDVWHFTEMPYPHLPPLDTLSTMRVTLPSRHYDPKIGADLYNRYLDEYMIADDLGFHHMVNEHHQTATCLDVAAPLSAAILARQTRKAASAFWAIRSRTAAIPCASPKKWP